ncbi:uncharacterized protein LOC144954686, partial [Lampetra fluviatilis]
QQQLQLHLQLQLQQWQQQGRVAQARVSECSSVVESHRLEVRRLESTLTALTAEFAGSVAGVAGPGLTPFLTRSFRSRPRKVDTTGAAVGKPAGHSDQHQQQQQERRMMMMRMRRRRRRRWRMMMRRMAAEAELAEFQRHKQLQLNEIYTSVPLQPHQVSVAAAASQ